LGPSSRPSLRISAVSPRPPRSDDFRVHSPSDLPAGTELPNRHYGAFTRMPEPRSATQPPPSTDAAEGILEINERGGGVLRDPKRNLIARAQDPLVSPDQIRKLDLRGGELLAGPTARDQRGVRLASITAVNGVPVAQWQSPTPLADTIAIDPTERLRFDTPGGSPSMRVVELFTPIGKGQRGLLVAPPRTGKTILLQQARHRREPSRGLHDRPAGGRAARGSHRHATQRPRRSVFVQQRS
jgi:hypothetical protein